MVHDLEENLRFRGLSHNGDGSGLIGLLSNGTASGHYHYGNVGERRTLAQFGQKSPAIHLRHGQIQKNKRRPSIEAGEHPKRFISVLRAFNCVTPKREKLLERLAQFAIIVDDQNHRKISSH
jgi:hypothetical protein